MQRRRLLGGLGLALAGPVAARQPVVRMAFGNYIPPFCFPETDSGIEVEVYREALA
ncbi:MAG: hypothetical protein ACK44A_07075 [Roseateles sp.]